MVNEPRRGCCALGTCLESKAHGGPGCYLCDVVAKLPQPRASKRVLDEDAVERVEPMELKAPTKAAAPKKALAAPPARRKAARSGNLW